MQKQVIGKGLYNWLKEHAKPVCRCGRYYFYNGSFDELLQYQQEYQHQRGREGVLDTLH